MWDLPGPGIEPMSFTLAGKLFPTEPFFISLKALFVMFVSFQFSSFYSSEITLKNNFYCYHIIFTVISFHMISYHLFILCFQLSIFLFFISWFEILYSNFCQFCSSNFLVCFHRKFVSVSVLAFLTITTYIQIISVAHLCELIFLDFKNTNVWGLLWICCLYKVLKA